MKYYGTVNDCGKEGGNPEPLKTSSEESNDFQSGESSCANDCVCYHGSMHVKSNMLNEIYILKR